MSSGIGYLTGRPRDAWAGLGASRLRSLLFREYIDEHVHSTLKPGHALAKIPYIGLQHLLLDDNPSQQRKYRSCNHRLALAVHLGPA